MSEVGQPRFNEEQADSEQSIGPIIDQQWHDMLTFLWDLMDHASMELIDQLQDEKDDLREEYKLAQDDKALRVVQVKLAELTRKINDARKQHSSKNL